jgi:Na+-translocating ferredoxin:NAD+ oxidoreductase RnfC subunit
MKCKIKGCNKTVASKGFCTSHYSQNYIKEKSKDPAWKVEYDRKRREYQNEKFKNDPEYREKKKKQMKKWSAKHYHEKMKEDPDWNRKRQREFRKRHPDSFNYIMCRCYFRKLNKEMRNKLVLEIEKEECI